MQETISMLLWHSALKDSGPPQSPQRSKLTRRKERSRIQNTLFSL
jgi:hypothetical protein